MAALFLRKTPWINSRLQQFFIACVQNTLLPEKNSKNYSLKLVGWSSFFLRRPHKLMKSSPMIWHHVVNVNYTVKILSICVAFLETLTLTKQCTYILFSLCEVEVEIWRVLLKGNSWYLESGRNVHTMVFHNRTNNFWSCFQYLHDFRRILMLKLRIIVPIIRAVIIFFQRIHH